MDTFNDHYNRFVANVYGVNVLNFVFFIAVFFIVILSGLVIILLNYGRNAPTQQPQSPLATGHTPIIIVPQRTEEGERGSTNTATTTANPVNNGQSA